MHESQACGTVTIACSTVVVAHSQPKELNCRSALHVRPPSDLAALSHEPCFRRLGSLPVSNGAQSRSVLAAFGTMALS